MSDTLLERVKLEGRSMSCNLSGLPDRSEMLMFRIPPMVMGTIVPL